MENSVKILEIKVVINKGKMAKITHSIGFDSNSMSDELEILGILENLKHLQQEKLKTKFHASKDKEGKEEHESA